MRLGSEHDRRVPAPAFLTAASAEASPLADDDCYVFRGDPKKVGHLLHTRPASGPQQWIREARVRMIGFGRDFGSFRGPGGLH